MTSTAEAATTTSVQGVEPVAMEQQPAELSFEFALRLEELHPEALRRGDEARLVSGIDLMGLKGGSTQKPPLTWWLPPAEPFSTQNTAF